VQSAELFVRSENTGALGIRTKVLRSAVSDLQADAMGQALESLPSADVISIESKAQVLGEDWYMDRVIMSGDVVAYGPLGAHDDGKTISEWLLRTGGPENGSFVYAGPYSMPSVDPDDPSTGAALAFATLPSQRRRGRSSWYVAAGCRMEREHTTFVCTTQAGTGMNHFA